MPRNRTGAKRERELVNLLDENGFAVMRAPSSGAATSRELPDALAGNGEVFLAIEAKSSSGDPIYLTGEEVDALGFFAENFGATAIIATRFNEKHGDPTYGTDELPWYFFRPNSLYQTDGGNYRVKKETALADGASLADLLSTG